MAASTQKKKTPAKKPASAARTSGKKPVRREVWALVCVCLALFTFIGCFRIDALFITYFCGFVKGLIGYGYYLFPVALAGCALILTFHHGRPVKARTICMLCVPVAIGALVHLFLCKLELKGVKVTELLPILYENGKEMRCGGLICGFLAIGFETLFSVYGAVPVFLFGTIALIMIATQVSPGKLIEMYKERMANRPQYVPEPAPERAPKQVPAQKAMPRSARTRTSIDIPMDDEPQEEYTEERVGLFNKRPRVKTPAQLLEQHNAADSSANALPEEEPQSTPAPAAEPTPAAIQQKTEPVPLKTEPTPLKTEPTPSARISAAVPKAPAAPVANLTEKVAPLSEDEAAKIAGVTLQKPEDVIRTEEFTTEQVREQRSNAKKKLPEDELRSATEEVAKAVEEKNAAAAPVYRYPPADLLRKGSGTAVDGSEEMRINSERLQATLDSFGVGAKICDITRGPTVTRYDLELSSGVKLAKLTNLAGDLALSLGVSGVRIAPIPNKISTVGIEVPNKIVSTVFLRDIIDTDVFRGAASRLTFALGKDIGGNAIVGNIAKLPHLLIAGTTGSGKSVCMNCLILSLLFKATPEEVRLIMIDPKMVELGIYNGIPHLYIPVVTDPKKAAGSLQWSVIEMLKRYRLFADAGVRDITGYNAMQKKNGEPILPQVVIVIDELADLMMTAAKEVEESICRVAQMGRAAGMHLVIATQRPSADVITGLMKANIPSRIAFAVSSAMESRIILDQMGAEKLVGSGDMLYAPLGVGKPTRIQGAFVTDDEREEVVNFVKQYGEAQYSEEIMASIEQAASDKPDAKDAHAESVDEAPESNYDELLPQAVDVIFETKQASVSMLQRRLKLGYSRAARIVDQMEEIGVVGPFEGSKPRQILITREQWLEMQAVQGTAPIENPDSQMNFADFQDDAPETWSD